MARSPIYNNNHNLITIDTNGFSENRNLNINIADCIDYLQLKLKDPNDFLFNYTINIDYNSFEIIRNEQHLDIDFSEFKTNLIDLLQQTSKQQMYLKCQLDGDNCCKLIFYNKSKIKSLIYLVIDLKLTNQKDIFDEINRNYFELQRINRQLQQQINSNKQQLSDKLLEIRQFKEMNSDLERDFVNSLKQIQQLFGRKLEEFSTNIYERIYKLIQQLMKLLKNLEIIKQQFILNNDNNLYLLKQLEDLNLEERTHRDRIGDLMKDNSNLKQLQSTNERLIMDLKQQLDEIQQRYNQLQLTKDEIEKDVKQATLIIAQKTAANEELTKDLVQANQMLVNFNHLYETKNKEIEDLQMICKNKDLNLQELINEFDEYKIKFNLNEQNRLKQELLQANKRIDEIEKSNREYIKLNELLTRKLAAGNALQPNCRS